MGEQDVIMVAQFKQYPHTITVTIAPAPVQNPDTGLWTQGAGVDTVFECRIEPNRQGRTINGANGQFEAYDYDILMPYTTTVIPRDSKCVLSTGENLTVRKQYMGQLKSRLWV